MSELMIEKEISEEKRFKKEILIEIIEDVTGREIIEGANILRHNIYLCIETNVLELSEYTSEIISFIMYSKEKVLNLKRFSKFMLITSDRAYCLKGNVDFVDGKVLLIIEDAIKNTSTNCDIELSGEYVFLI